MILICLQADNRTKTGRQKTQAHLQDFLSTVRSLGITFNVYQLADKWEWTSLLGKEKKILLRKLPNQFEKFLPAAKVEMTQVLWNVSVVIYSLIFLPEIHPSIYSMLSLDFDSMLGSSWLNCHFLLHCLYNNNLSFVKAWEWKCFCDFRILESCWIFSTWRTWLMNKLQLSKPRSVGQLAQASINWGHNTNTQTSNLCKHAVFKHVENV